MAYPTPHFFEAPNPDKKGFHAICYYEWGSKTAAKTVVCVHGLTRNARDFDFLASSLADDGFRVISIDIPGRGKSEWLTDRKWYEYKTYANDVIRLLKSLDISNCYWVGTSMGWLIAMAVNAFSPRLIERLILNDIGYAIPKDAMNRLATYVGSQVHFENYEEYNRALSKILIGFGIKDPAHWNYVLSISAKKNDDSSYDLLYDPTINHIFRDDNGNPKTLEAVDLSFLWRKIKCPTMLIRGEKSDLVSHEMALKMKAQHKHFELAEIPDVGHAPALMEKSQIDIVRKFLLDDSLPTPPKPNLITKWWEKMLYKIFS